LGDDSRERDNGYTQGATRSASSSDRTKSTAGAKATRKRQRKKATYKHEVKPLIERLLTHMELILLTDI
jgi:hypothetical protein